MVVSHFIDNNIIFTINKYAIDICVTIKTLMKALREERLSTTKKQNAIITIEVAEIYFLV